MLGIRMTFIIDHTRMLFWKKAPSHFTVTFWADEGERADNLFFSSAEIRRVLAGRNAQLKVPLGGIIVFISKKGTHGTFGYSGSFNMPNGKGFASHFFLKAAQLLHREIPSIQTITVQGKIVPIASLIPHLQLKIARNRYQRGKRRKTHTRERRRIVLTRLFNRFGSPSKMRKRA